MKEDVLLRKLEVLPPQTYIHEARRHGRMNIDPGIRDLASRLFEMVLQFQRTEPFLSAEAVSTFELASRVFFSDWFLAKNPLPRYQAYTNIRVLNWALETNHLRPLDQVMRSAWRAIQILVHDLQEFEVRSIAGLEKNFQVGLNVDAIRKRLDKLSVLVAWDTCEGIGLLPVDRSWKADSWVEIAADHSRSMALVAFTSFPQTAQHDEVLFLRTIHCSECCFWGVLAAVTAALEETKHSRMERATRLLQDGVGFAQFLVPLVEVMKTMPPEAFREFRNATGDASAIQSRTYQRMQIHLQGLDASKVGYLNEIPELSDLLLFGHPNFKHLRNVVQQMEASSSDSATQEFLGAAQALDDALFEWRKLHLGVAKKYLADIAGSGGTPGFAYLKSHYAHKVFSKEPGLGPVEEVAATGTHGCVNPLLGPTN